MDKVFSARVDESTARQIGSLAHRLGTSKKQIIEQAISLYATRVETEEKIDVFDRTSGAWRRKDSPDVILEKARQAFRRSMMRSQP